MTSVKGVIETVVREVETVLDAVKENEALSFIRHIQKTSRIFIIGEGRSGLMGKAFAMRLMHSGRTVFVVGETITPNIEPNDCLIAISGSGSTGTVLHGARKAKQSGARVLLVTTNPDSDIGAISDAVLTVPAATKHRRAHEPKTIQPLGNQFDQSVHLLLDAIIIYFLRSQNTGDETLKNRHANLE